MQQKGTNELIIQLTKTFEVVLNLYFSVASFAQTNLSFPCIHKVTTGLEEAL